MLMARGCYSQQALCTSSLMQLIVKAQTHTKYLSLALFARSARGRWAMRQHSYLTIAQRQQGAKLLPQDLTRLWNIAFAHCFCKTQRLEHLLCRSQSSWHAPGQPGKDLARAQKISSSGLRMVLGGPSRAILATDCRKCHLLHCL